MKKTKTTPAQTSGRSKPVKPVADDRAALARRIVAERERLGVKQKIFAWRAGLAVETLSRIENLHVSATPETLAKIEKAIAEFDQELREGKGRDAGRGRSR